MRNGNKFLKTLSGAGLKRYKRLPLIICTALMIISAVGLIISFSLPAKIGAKTTHLAYVQSGKFDYQAFLKPSYLLGPEPAPSATPTPSPLPQSALKYPFADIQQFNFSFDYQLDSEQPISKVVSRMAVEASTTDADGKALTLDLFSSDQVQGQAIHVQFPLVMEDSFRGKMITVNITVYPTLQTGNGVIYESFSQTLTFKVEGQMLVLQRGDLEKSQSGYTGSTGYKQTGKAGFSVVLDSGEGVTEVFPPAVPTPAPAPTPEPQPEKVLGPADVIYTKLVDRIEAGFKYHFYSSKAVENLQEEVALSAVIQGGDVWSKTLELVPLTKYSGDFNIPFEIDFNKYSQMIENIRSETGVSAESYNLVIRADIHLTGDTAYGKLDETFSPTLTTNLDKGVLSWTEKMEQSKDGSIQTAALVPNPDRYLGLSLGGLKTLSAVLWIFFVICLLVLAFLTRKYDTSAPSRINREEARIRKKYGEMLVVSHEDGAAEGAELIRLDSMEDLVKVADALGKPVIHIPPDGYPDQLHAYQVYDGKMVYRYELRG